MNTVVQVRDKKFALYISEEKIKTRVAEVAAQIDEDLRKKNPLFLVLLNGSFVYAADLLRDINFPCEISFVKMSSYEGTSSTGEVKQLIGLNENVVGRTVVIVEDIIESGTTMKALLHMLAVQMKKNLNNWNKEGIEDQKIVDDLREYSNGAIDLKVEDLRLNDQQRHNNNNNNNQRKQNNQNNQRKQNNQNNQRRKQQY
jgi:hypoxanthine phosphoribosyltransferase